MKMDHFLPLLTPLPRVDEGEGKSQTRHPHIKMSLLWTMSIIARTFHWQPWNGGDILFMKRFGLCQPLHSKKVNFSSRYIPLSAVYLASSETEGKMITWSNRANLVHKAPSSYIDILDEKTSEVQACLNNQVLSSNFLPTLGKHILSWYATDIENGWP